MNKQEELIQEQLKRIQFADLSNYEEKTNTYHIPKINQIKLKINHQYIIKIKDSLYENIILRDNYNSGKNPPCKCYLVDVVLILGKIIKVNGVEYDLTLNKVLNNLWSGYLAIKDIEILEERE